MNIHQKFEYNTHFSPNDVLYGYIVDLNETGIEENEWITCKVSPVSYSYRYLDF